MDPVSLDFALLSTVTNLLPDTSGLTPLSLPEEFLSRDNTSQPQPSPDAIRRFQSALASAPSSRPAIPLDSFSAPETVCHPASLSPLPHPESVVTEPLSAEQTAFPLQLTTSTVPVSLDQTPSTDGGNPKIVKVGEDVGISRLSKSSHGVDGSGEQTEETPPPVLQALPFAVSAPIETPRFAGEIPPRDVLPIQPADKTSRVASLSPDNAQAGRVGEDTGISRLPQPLQGMDGGGNRATETTPPVPQSIPSVAFAPIEAPRSSDEIPPVVPVPVEASRPSDEISSRDFWPMQSADKTSRLASLSADNAQDDGVGEDVGISRLPQPPQDMDGGGNRAAEMPSPVPQASPVAVSAPIEAPRPAAEIPPRDFLSMQPADKTSQMASLSPDNAPASGVGEYAGISRLSQPPQGMDGGGEHTKETTPSVTQAISSAPTSIDPASAFSTSAPREAVELTATSSPDSSRRPSAPPREFSFPSAPLQAVPLDLSTPPAAPVALPDTPSTVSAASARTASITETANQVASIVASRILATPVLSAGGNGEVRIALQPAVLDGSTVTLTAHNGTLAVSVAPATPEAAALAAAALPHLAAALETHAPAFHRVQVALATKKGAADETV